MQHSEHNIFSEYNIFFGMYANVFDCYYNNLFFKHLPSAIKIVRRRIHLLEAIMMIR